MTQPLKLFRYRIPVLLYSPNHTLSRRPVGQVVQALEDYWVFSKPEEDFEKSKNEGRC